MTRLWADSSMRMIRITSTQAVQPLGVISMRIVRMVLLYKLTLMVEMLLFYNILDQQKDLGIWELWFKMHMANGFIFIGDRPHL